MLALGDAGCGKTTLLSQFAAQDAADAGILRVAGYSSESDLPYAGLDRLLLPLQTELSALEPRLRDALAVATGHRSGEPPDRFQVGLGMLTLLGAMTAPTVVLVDDAHLLDRETLAFVARRLNAESLLMLFASRPDADVEATLSGVATIALDGLDSLSGVALVNHGRLTPLDPRLALTVVDQLAGHGEYPAREALWHAILFRTSRAFDLARAIGADTTLPDDLVEATWKIVEPHAEEWRELGVFGPAIEVDADAPLQDRLMGLTGRRP